MKKLHMTQRMVALCLILGGCATSSSRQPTLPAAYMQEGVLIQPLEGGMTFRLPDLYQRTAPLSDSGKTKSKDIKFLPSSKNTHPERKDRLTFSPNLVRPSFMSFDTYFEGLVQGFRSFDTTIIEEKMDTVARYRHASIGGFYTRDGQREVIYIIGYENPAGGFHSLQWVRAVLPGETPQQVLADVKRSAEQSFLLS